jgi:hypothetical protein
MEMDMQEKTLAERETVFNPSSSKGEATKLIELMERRFGPIPDWALLQIKNATEDNVEHWVVNFAQANSIDDVFEL